MLSDEILCSARRCGVVMCCDVVLWCVVIWCDMAYIVVQHGVQCNVIPFHSIQCNAIRCDADAIWRENVMWCGVVWYDVRVWYKDIHREIKCYCWCRTNSEGIKQSKPKYKTKQKIAKENKTNHNWILLSSIHCMLFVRD